MAPTNTNTPTKIVIAEIPLAASETFPRVAVIVFTASFNLIRYSFGEIFDLVAP